MLSVTNDLIGAASVINYCNLPIKCCFYLSIDYLIKDCKDTKAHKENIDTYSEIMATTQPLNPARTPMQEPLSPPTGNHRGVPPLPPPS